MAEMLLVNPRRKRRRARKMTALQRRYFGKGHGRITRARRNPKRRRHAALAVTGSAAPKRKYTKRTRSRSYRARRHISRNVASFRGFSPRGFLTNSLMPAAVGAGGALGVDLALGYFGSYLPATLQTGLPNAAVKLAGAIGIGMLAGAVAGKRVGEQAMAGAIVVTLYSVIKSQLISVMPALPLHGYSGIGWVSPAMQIGNVGSYVGSDRAYGMPHVGMSEYVGEKDSDYY
jgi:hypothetical protein